MSTKLNSKKSMINWLEERAAWWRQESNRLLTESNRVRMEMLHGIGDMYTQSRLCVDLKDEADIAYRNAISLQNEAHLLKSTPKRTRKVAA